MGRPKVVTDKEIRTTARRCFLEYGPSFSLAGIAKELGISDAAILKRVGSKDVLLRQCLEPDKRPQNWLAALRSDPDAGPLVPQLVTALEQAQEALSESIPMLAALRMSGLDVERSRLSGKLAHPVFSRRVLERWLDHAKASHGLAVGDTGAAANLLLSLVECQAFHRWVSRDVDQAGPDWGQIVAVVLEEPAETVPLLDSG